MVNNTFNKRIVKFEKFIASIFAIELKDVFFARRICKISD